MNPEIFDVNLPVNIMHILYEDDYDDGVDDVDDDDDEQHYHDQHDDDHHHHDYDAKMQIFGEQSPICLPLLTRMLPNSNRDDHH